MAWRRQYHRKATGVVDIQVLPPLPSIADKRNKELVQP